MCVQLSVAPLRMSLEPERKGNPLQNMVRLANALPCTLRATLLCNLAPRHSCSSDELTHAQAKGLLNGFTAATLMFAPGAMVPPSYAAEEGVAVADAEAPKPKVISPPNDPDLNVDEYERRDSRICSRCPWASYISSLHLFVAESGNASGSHASLRMRACAAIAATRVL